MSERKRCPRCGLALVKMAKIDSDDRVYSKWLRCDNMACNWDERFAPPPDPDQREAREA